MHILLSPRPLTVYFYMGALLSVVLHSVLVKQFCPMSGVAHKPFFPSRQILPADVKESIAKPADSSFFCPLLKWPSFQYIIFMYLHSRSITLII